MPERFSCEIFVSRTSSKCRCLSSFDQENCQDLCCCKQNELEVDKVSFASLHFLSLHKMSFPSF